MSRFKAQRIEPEDFEPAHRAYPYTDGEVSSGVEVCGNQVIFRGQMGAVSDVGVNGCQIDDLVKFSRVVIETFNQKVPSVENFCVLQALDEAIWWFKKRTEDRLRRGVEGTTKR